MASAALRDRYSFANLDEVLPLPDLIAVQRESFEWFLHKGLAETFRDIRPTNTLLVCQIPTPGAKVEIELTAHRAG